MKVQLLICIVIFTWIQKSVYAESVLNPASTHDTIAKLEKRIESNLSMIHTKIEEQKKIFESLHNDILTLANNKTQLKKTKNELTKIQEELQFSFKKQNVYRQLLTMTRQLKIQHENIASAHLREIDKAIKTLDKNKLPSLQNFKSIPAIPYIRDNIIVYANEISSLCNLTKSPDGKILANEFENFFEYTDPKISTHFKETDFLKCQARFIKTKKEYFLELKFVVNSPKAASIYGTIDPSNPSKIDFINGDFIYLETYALTSGILDPETGSTIYNVQFKLDREDIRNISKKDIDSVTILWTSGADQFEICKIDLLRNMFECIQKRKLPN